MRLFYGTNESFSLRIGQQFVTSRTMAEFGTDVLVIADLDEEDLTLVQFEDDEAEEADEYIGVADVFVFEAEDEYGAPVQIWELASDKALEHLSIQSIRVLNENPSPSYLGLSKVRKYEDMAKKRGVSEVARSQSGFLSAFKRAGGRKSSLSEHWRSKRDAFVARHMAQVRQNKEQLWEDGKPTRRHLALIMWAYSPTPGKL